MDTSPRIHREKETETQFGTDKPPAKRFLSLPKGQSKIQNPKSKIE